MLVRLWLILDASKEAPKIYADRDTLLLAYAMEGQRHGRIRGANGGWTIFSYMLHVAWFLLGQTFGNKQTVATKQRVVILVCSEQSGKQRSTTGFEL